MWVWWEERNTGKKVCVGVCTCEKFNVEGEMWAHMKCNEFENWTFEKKRAWLYLKEAQ